VPGFHFLGRPRHMANESLIRIAKVIGKYIPALLLILIFAPQGYAKFSDTSGWARAFRTWGYPVWFRITIGVIELLAVVLLLWGRTAAVGAILIICVMLGAWELTWLSITAGT